MITDPSMELAQVAALRSKALAVGAEIVAMDRHGGQKGVGRFMFGGACSFSRSQMHEREFAMMADLPVVDSGKRIPTITLIDPKCTPKWPLFTPD